MSYKPNDSRIPVWQVMFGAFIGMCIALYIGFWAQDRVGDVAIYQFIAYAFFLIAFGIFLLSIQYMINTYRAKQTKLTSRYRSDEYQKSLAKMSRKYKRTGGRFGR